MSPARRFASSMFVVALFGGVAGCFAIFPLDPFNEGSPLVVDASPTDAGRDAITDTGSSDSADVIAPVTGRLIFVTSTTVDGKLGDAQIGVQGGNAICTALATAAKRSGIFVAILGAEPALQDLLVSDAARNRPIVDTAGRTVAASAVDLFEKGPLVELDRDERGAQISAPNGAAICQADGQIQPFAWISGCDEFTANGPGKRGEVGLPKVKASWRMSECQVSCDRSAHLYCVQQ